MRIFFSQKAGFAGHSMSEMFNMSVPETIAVPARDVAADSLGDALKRMKTGTVEPVRTVGFVWAVTNVALWRQCLDF